MAPLQTPKIQRDLTASRPEDGGGVARRPFTGALEMPQPPARADPASAAVNLPLFW